MKSIEQHMGAVDVLAVLREYARDTGAFRVTNQAAARLAAACAAVSMLVEADQEFDAAKEAMRKTPMPRHADSPLIPAWDEARARVKAADARRSAALARVSGAA